MMRSDEQICMFIIYVVVCAFVICKNHFLNSGSPFGVSVSVPRAEKVLAGYLENPRNSA